MIEMKDILKGLREQKQVSMDKMCNDLNNIYNVSIAKSTISKWENGKAEPSLAYARILTKYFNVTLDYLLGLEKDEMYNFNKLSKQETILLENYKKSNDEGKKMILSYSDYVSQNYKNTNTTDEISATKDNVIEFNNKKDEEEVFVPYKSFDELGAECNAAHADDLTPEKLEHAKQVILESENELKLAEWNKKHNK